MDDFIKRHIYNRLKEIIPNRFKDKFHTKKQSVDAPTDYNRSSSQINSHNKFSKRRIILFYLLLACKGCFAR